jgi:hypothetical protein
VGVAVGFAQDAYSVISVAGGGNEGIVNVTVGVLKDLTQNKLAILLQVRFPMPVVLAASDYFVALTRQLPAFAEDGRKRLGAVAGGTPYTWNDGDLRRLLLRSMM